MKKLKKDWIHQFGFEVYANAYGYRFLCDNCIRSNWLWIKEGVRIPKKVICNNCKCETKT